MKILILVFALVTGFTYSQNVNRVHLVDHIDYMINVLREVVNEVERRHWCNLKVPEITSAVSETVLDRHYEGTVTYSNGFLSSMQKVDLLQAGVNQIWSWNTTSETGSVQVSATLRMLDVSLGYDVVADLQDGRHRHTVTVTYPLVQFVFNILKNVHTEEVNVAVTGTITTTATVSRIKFLPADNTTDVLTTLFNIALPGEGIRAWGADVFAPILLDVYSNKVQFPRICYDCPVV